MAEAGELIRVKFSEDLAQYADLRPVRHQPMTLHELVGLVLTTTGKDSTRVRERLRAGTCTYNIYRYWWEGFELEEARLAAALAEFPDPDPARALRAEDCLWVQAATAGPGAPHTLLVEKREAARRRWFRRRSFWEALMAFAGGHAPAYRDYSYYHRADLYGVELSASDRAQLREAARQLARRSLLLRWERGQEWAQLELACRR